jgi:hypothetical protein
MLLAFAGWMTQAPLECCEVLEQDSRAVLFRLFPNYEYVPLPRTVQKMHFLALYLWGVIPTDFFLFVFGISALTEVTLTELQASIWLEGVGIVCLTHQSSPCPDTLLGRGLYSRRSKTEAERG